ncbi:MAG: isoleucine--tRNA ligase [Candidatus Micrarchaeota archaeon]|nr:isoleucine--tRNA ligase [Candidatus Micrarchaeota archaeon]
MHDQVKLENEILAFWNSEKIYNKMKAACADGKPFYFCDGPPYATGQIHPGTAWNKSIKDSVCRYKRARGFAVRAQPGFDTHGLPIEVKVEQELKISDKRQIEQLGVDKFVQKCKSFATQYIGVISRQFERCGVWMDWDNPYITYKDDFIESSWKTLKAAHEKGLLHEGVRVVPYCSRCETTLANYELEYGEQSDPSIYVKFKSLSAENEYFVIWTTTPWTLVSNMAIMAHPIYTYVKVKVGDETWILAKDRLEAVLGLLGTSATVLGEISGKKLEKLQYAHPLEAKIGKKYDRRVVISDDFVTLEDGSGLVHCAPGHGPEDFIVGKRFGLEIFSPIDSSGKFTSDAGVYSGIAARAASVKVIEDLKECNALLHEGKISHRYPHCWRCKTPLIFIATNQWFIAITKLKDRMLEQIGACEWHPDFAKTRFTDFVASAPDWCISRQRYWGIPLPIWKCDSCSHLHVIGSREELPSQVEELHRPYIDKIKFKCEKCSSTAHRVPDVMDVWFDSGNAVWASLSKQESQKYSRADFIVEGKDQTRGWFYSLLGSGTVLNNEIPYKTLLMHGFFVDEKGEKMSKSVGNFVPLEEIMDKYGADTFRLWCLSNTVWDDLRFNWNEIKEAHRAIGTFYNVGVFLSRFYSANSKPSLPERDSLRPEDRWMLSRMASVNQECTEAFENYQPHTAAKALRTFLLEDLSRFYMKLAKERIDEEGVSCPAMAILYHALLDSLVMLTPIAPFTPESIYISFFRKFEHKESISMLAWPTADKTSHDSLLERRFEIARNISTAAANARQKADLKLRWPLEELCIVSESTEVLSSVEHLSELIGSLTNVRKVKASKQPKTKVEITINKSKVGAAFKKESAKALLVLESESKEKLAVWLASDETEYKTENFAFTREMATATETAEGFAIASFEGGKVFLKTAQNRELYEESMVREVARRVQMMRKEKKLVESDRIAIHIHAEDKELDGIIKRHSDALCAQVNAEAVFLAKHAGGSFTEWEIGEAKVEISIEKR